MLVKNKSLLIITGAIMIILLVSFISPTTEINNINNEEIERPKTAATLEGIENVLITDINREANISGYGLLNIVDKIEVQNLNNNPITSIFIGIPLNFTDDLIYYEATGSEKNSLLTEKSNLIMEGYELIAIYFDTPLQPEETTSIRFYQSYKDLIRFGWDGSQQVMSYQGLVYPAFPYKAEGEITAEFVFPDSSTLISYDWGSDEDNAITFDFTKIPDYPGHIDPFFGNIQGGNENITLTSSEEELTKIEVEELTREISISTWGIIRVKEDFKVVNKGILKIDTLDFKIPGPAKQVQVYDDLGELIGVVVDPETEYYNLTYKDLEIDLSENRVSIEPETRVKFTIEYHLPVEKHVSINWFTESFKIDALTTRFEFLGREQTIKIKIEGAFWIDSVSTQPDSIESEQSVIILIYDYDYITPFDQKMIQITFTVNYFNMIFRPIIFIVILALILSTYVIIVKNRKAETEADILARELLPIKEIREFCSLNEEKNALLIEIRNSEDLAKKKKMAKKKYKNILNKNNSKIEEIQRELIPFKKIILNTSANFEKIIKKLDVLEAERESVKDSLTLLETRYKRGRLPSKAAYEKLSNNFFRRQDKVDRTIDKLIQQLRSYLL